MTEKSIVAKATAPQLPQAPSRALLTAELLAIERGLSVGFSVADVASAAGLSLDEVTCEFPNREALERAVMSRCVVTAQQSLGLPIDMNVSLDVMLANLLHMSFDAIDGCESRYRVQLQAMAKGGALFSEVVQATCTPVVQLVKTMIQERRPDLTCAEVEARACMFVGMCDQYAHIRWTYFPHLKLDSQECRFYYEYRKLAETHFVQSILQ